MVRWLRWHCPPDTGFEIRALAVWGRARYLSVTEAPHNTNFHTWMGKKQFRFFKPPRPGTEPRTLAWKAAVLTTTLGPPPITWSSWKFKFYSFGVLSSWKNKKKSEKNSDQPYPTHPPLYPIFFYFFQTYTTTTEKKKKKKKKKSPPKKESELGLDPPTHLRVFLWFLDYFNHSGIRV